MIFVFHVTNRVAYVNIESHNRSSGWLSLCLAAAYSLSHSPPLYPLLSRSLTPAFCFDLCTAIQISACIVSDDWCFVMQNRVTEQIPLDPLANKTGDIWHVLLRGNFDDMLYAYKFEGPMSPQEGHYYDSSRLVLDPYAKVSGLYHYCCPLEQTSLFVQSCPSCFAIWKGPWMDRICKFKIYM